MKYIFTLSLIFALSLGNIHAQTTVPDFTLTDINGNSYTLYEELAEGKRIVLDFFALQCGSCQTGISLIENVWQNYGNNGDDVWVWAIEALGGNNIDIHDFIYNNGGSFPGFSITENDTLFSYFNISYTPQYYVICQNGFIKSCGVDEISDYLDACQEAFSLDEESGFQEQSKINSISTLNDLEILFTNNTNSPVSFDLFDILGNRISQKSGFYPQGKHTINMSKSGLAHGYYFVRMFENGEYVNTKKFVIQ